MCLFATTVGSYRPPAPLFFNNTVAVYHDTLIYTQVINYMKIACDAYAC